METQRYFLSLSYNGLAYHGWQRQPKGATIQEAVERRMHLILRQPVELTTAGRTDTGVHARKTFAHFDGPAGLDPAWLTKRLNSFLPPDIAVRYIIPVPAEAHARYDAVRREYAYHLIDRKDPFLKDFAWRLEAFPDWERINQAAAILLQYEDFESFSKVKTDVKHFRCRLDYARWERIDRHHWVFRIGANRFLRNMVRAIVGTLVEIGQGKRPPEAMHAILEARDRRAAGASAPGHGLFLENVVYKPEIQALIDRAEETLG